MCSHVFPVAEAELLDGVQQQLLLAAGPAALRLRTPECESSAVYQLVAVVAAVVADLRAGREALGAQLDLACWVLCSQRRAL